MQKYRWSLLPGLSTKIEFCQSEAAFASLKELLRITFEQSKGEISLWKLRCAQIASMSLRGALRGGGSSDLLMQEHMEMLNKLCVIRNKEKLIPLMRKYIGQLLEHVGSARHTNIEHAVSLIQKKVRQSLRTPRTLFEYAAMLNVSVSHLSRSFSRIVGHPFRQELRIARMEKASKLLSQTPLKISAVAQSVGLRDASQFIMDFRRENGITPGQYRKIHSHLRMKKR
ncbi:MAG: helix-turn-helix transcriptional regulator [Chthoniobacterales bacterium]